MRNQQATRPDPKIAELGFGNKAETAFPHFRKDSFLGRQLTASRSIVFTPAERYLQIHDLYCWSSASEEAAKLLLNFSIAVFTLFEIELNQLLCRVSGEQSIQPVG